MEINKSLDKQIYFEVFSVFLFLGIFLIGGYVIYHSMNNGATSNSDLIIDIKDEHAPSNLYIMSDSSGLSINPYVINITNNRKRKANYKVFFKHNIVTNLKIEEYLKVSVDGVVTKFLKDFEVDKKGNYVIITGDLEKGYTASHSVRVWLDSASPNILSGTASSVIFVVEGN